jgi:hypothetical protein
MPKVGARAVIHMAKNDCQKRLAQCRIPFRVNRRYAYLEKKEYFHHPKSYRSLLDPKQDKKKRSRTVGYGAELSR